MTKANISEYIKNAIIIHCIDMYKIWQTGIFGVSCTSMFAYTSKLNNIFVQKCKLKDSTHMHFLLLLKVSRFLPLSAPSFYHTLAFKLSSTDTMFVLFCFTTLAVVLLTLDNHELLLFWLREPLFWIYDAVSLYCYCTSAFKTLERAA